MDKNNLAFGKLNFVILAVGMVIVILGFILMSGGVSTEDSFNPAIFDAQRIKVAPIVCLIGFVTMIAAVIIKAKDSK